MRKRIEAFCVAALVAAFVAFHCSASAAEGVADPVSMVQGTWQSGTADAEPDSFQLKGEKLRFDDGVEMYVVVEQRDGRAVARIAGLDEVVWVATFVDKDRIDCYFPRLRKLVSYDRETELSVEDLYGRWKVRELSGRRETEVVFRLGDGFIEMDGNRLEKVAIEKNGAKFRIIPEEFKDEALVVTVKSRNRLDAYLDNDRDERFSLTRLPDGEGRVAGDRRVMDENAKNAVAALKAYVTAQVTFQAGRQGREKANSGAGNRGYADNFRNLFYGTPAGNKKVNLQFLRRDTADAFAGPGAGVAVVDAVAQPAATAVPYHGYLFLEPPGVDFSADFALVAYPEKFNQTGDAIFWIGQDGVVRKMLSEFREDGEQADGDGPRLITGEETPLNAPELWMDAL